MQKIWNPKLEDILPRNILADDKMKAAAEALDLELKALSYDAWQVLHLPRLNELDHDVLDTLAYQFHCDHYEPSTMSLDTKRNLIRQSILWHRVKGTPKSLENFLGAFGINAKVQEWWEYGGEPYFFKLTLSDVAFLGDDGETFIRLIYAAKNERSWLDAFIFDLSTDDPDDLILGNINAECDFDEINLANVADSKVELSVANIEQDISTGIVDYDFNIKIPPTDYIVGNMLGLGGYIEIKAEIDDDDFDGDWYKIIWENWLKWKHNPLIKIYNHHFDVDQGEIDPDDPEPEIFPDGDFLRLYFKFPNTKRIRYTTLYNPRKEVAGREINAVGNYAAANKLMLNWRGDATTGITRALLIERTIEKIF